GIDCSIAQQAELPQARELSAGLIKNIRATAEDAVEGRDRDQHEEKAQAAEDTNLSGSCLLDCLPQLPYGVSLGELAAPGDNRLEEIESGRDPGCGQQPAGQRITAREPEFFFAFRDTHNTYAVLRAIPLSPN